MNFEFETTGHALTDSEISAFQAGARLKLPPQYRAFISQQNGCLPKGMLHLSSGFDADVSEFYPLFDLDKERSTAVHWTHDLIWFACDSGGGEFAIAHTGQNFGKIVWFDTPHSALQAPSSTDAQPVASTFNAFIESIEPSA